MNYINSCVDHIFRNTFFWQNAYDIWSQVPILLVYVAMVREMSMGKPALCFPLFFKNIISNRYEKEC